VYLTFGLTPTGMVMFALVSVLIAISFIDLEFRIIPNVISYPGMTLGLLLGIVSQFTPYFQCAPEATFCPITQSATDSLLGWLFGGGVFIVIGEVYYRVTNRVGLGFGDVKLMGMTGAILGWQSVFPTIFVGALLGSVVGVIVMVVRSSGRHTEIPFGPWLSLGAVLYLFQLSQGWTITF
jgi:leader peptidase (prepilin peptidase)/N-methyltransferase